MYYMNAGHMGLALATTVAAYLNAGLLLRGLLRDGVYQRHGGWGGYTLRLGLATAGMTAILVFLAHPTAQWLAWDWQRRALELGLLCGAGAGAYLGIHMLLGTRLRHLRTPSAP